MKNSIKKNFSISLIGTVISSAVSLLTLTIIARELGAVIFGIFAIAQTYARVIDGIFNFQTWQALIKYITSYQENLETKKISEICIYSYIIDSVSAFFAATIGIFFIHKLTSFASIEDKYNLIFLILTFPIYFNVTGTALATLRIYDRYDLLSIINTLSASLKLLGTAISLFLLKEPENQITIICTIWAVSDIISYTSQNIFAIKTLKNNNITISLKIKEIRKSISGKKDFLLFASSTNISATIRLLTQELDTIIVGAFITPAAAGYYQIAKRYASILAKIADPLQQAIFPKLSTFAARNDINSFKNIIKNSIVFGATISSVFLISATFIGPYAIKIFLGPEYSNAYPILISHTIVYSILISGASLRPAAIALEKQKLIIYIYIFSTIMFYLCLPILSQRYGALGVSMSHIVFNFFWFILMIIPIITRRANS